LLLDIVISLRANGSGSAAALLSGRLQAAFYERACQEQTSTSAAGQGFFPGQLAPSPSGVAFVPKLLTAFLSLRSAWPLWFALETPG
jgi:hypothetical protein